MIPGPIELEPETLQVLAQPLLPHYGKEWLELYHQTVGMLKEVFQTKEEVLMIPGSGSAGLEAALGSLLGLSGGQTEVKVLVLRSGFFGGRLLEIARAYAAPEDVLLLEGEPDRPIPPEQVEELLASDPKIKVVAAVHCETSTGLLNPVREWSEVCRRHGRILVVDAISSLGGVELRFDEWGLGICVSASQKALEAPPGLALVAISREAWEEIRSKESPGWYLNLRTWRAYAERWAEWHPYPVTLPVSIILALRHSLERILDEGLEARFARHRKIARLLRQGLRNLGFELLIPEEYSSPTVTTALGRPDFPAEEVIAGLKRRGILIAGGLEELHGRIFRIGHMGSQATPEMVLPVLFHLEELLGEAGLPVEPGQSLRGVQLQPTDFPGN